MYLAIGIGGIIGALLRFFISGYLLNLGYFPFAGTLFVNLTGCFILGYLNGIARVYELPPWLVAGIGTGIIGAFTTFSTFSIEVVDYLKHGFKILSMIYILISSFGGYFFAYKGFLFANPQK